MAKVDIPLPEDVVVGNAVAATSKATVRSIDDIMADEMILDVGPESATELANLNRFFVLSFAYILAFYS